MPAVWYVGRWNEYNISTESWESSVGSALPPQVWNASNGWSVSHSVLTQEQLDMLEQMNDFRIGQANGPRVFPAPPPIADPEDDTASSYTYYLAIKEIVENFVPTNVTIDATNFVLKTPDSLKGAKFQIPAGQTTLTTRTHILPAVDSTLASLAGTEDLSNKTLTAPILSGTVTGTYTLGGTPTLTSARVNQLMDTGGLVALIINPVASAVNRLQISGAVTTGAPYVMAIGPDTNIDLNLRTTGTGVVRANGVELVTLSGTQALTGKTLTAPRITSGILDSAGLQLLGLQATASAVNYVNIISRATGVAPTVEAIGSDTDVHMVIRGQGAGRVNITNLTAANPQLTGTYSLTSPRVNQILDTGGATALSVVPTASAVNYWSITNAAAGNGVHISAVGGDTNIASNYWTKGNGAHFFRGGDGNTALILAPATGGVNGVRIDSAIAGSGVTIAAVGVDAAINFNVAGKGTGRVVVTNLTTSGQAVMLDPRLNRVFDYTNNVEVMRFNGAVGAVNFLSFSAAITGVPLFFSASGTDTDIGMNFVPKGAGRATVTNLSATSAILTSPRIITALLDANGAGALSLTATASAVNYFEMINNASGTGVILRAVGADANIVMYLRAKGTAGIFMQDAGGASILNLIPVASAVNYLQIGNSASGTSLSVYAAGTDPNINIAYSTKGLGSHFFRDGSGTSIFTLTPVASGVNGISILGAIAGGTPTIVATGGDPNINLALSGKGTGSLIVQSSTYLLTGKAFMVMNTSDFTNFERVAHQWTSNVYEIVAQSGGTGVGRSVRLAGTHGSVTAHSGAQGRITGCVQLSAGSGGSDVAIAGVNGILSGSTLFQYGLSVMPTFNQSGSAGYTVLIVNAFETAIGSGTKLLADFQVANISKAKIDRDGVVTPGKYTTGTRPTAASAGEGGMIFDTTLDKPIWSDGAIWRDAVGAAV